VARKSSNSPSLRPLGELFVWMTSMGLSLGLLMILGLLALVIFNGAQTFWPKRVVQVRVKDDNAFQFAGGKTLAGEIVKQQKKIIHELAQREAAAARHEDTLEWQLYVGNRDLFGANFVYIDPAAIAEEGFPRDIMVFRRMEYGNAIGYPLSLKLKDGTVLAASDPAFGARLQSLNDETSQRRKEIERVEKKQIGGINARMLGLRRQQRTVQSSAHSPAEKDTALAGIESAMNNLQSEYEVLAKKAGDLRKMQDENQLVYRAVNRQEKILPLGQLVEFYHPNQLGFSQRLGWLFHNLWLFLSQDPREANMEGGVFPAIFGTFVMTLLMSIAVTPFGVLAAIYLREYARQGVFVRAVRIAINNLAGVPSIVFGVFGLGFFVYFVGGVIDSLFFKSALPTPTFGTGGIVWAALTLALMTVPVVIVATEEAISAVPRGMREGSLACGASKWQTIQRIVIPASIPGIITGLVLAMARGAGEVAPLMLVGVVKLAPSLPLDGTFPYVHLERKFMHLGFHIYDLGFQSPDSEAAKPMVFATTLLLIALVVVLNLGAIVIREKLRRRYATGAF